MFNWFAAGPAKRFGEELAIFVLAEIAASSEKRSDKFTAKVEKVLTRADQRVREFKAQHALNVYKKAKLANAFLWTLKDRGCAPDYADQLTEWLSVRL